MKLIVDIDENLYTRLFDNGDNEIDDMAEALVVLRKGTPAPKGKWVRDKDGYWVCSVCGAIGASPHVSEPPDRYCHECGAQMEW